MIGATVTNCEHVPLKGLEVKSQHFIVRCLQVNNNVKSNTTFNWEKSKKLN